MQKDSHLKLLLLPNTDKVKKRLKSYKDLPAEKYSHILSQVEYSIASYYSENPSGLNDKKVQAVLESLLRELNGNTVDSDPYTYNGSHKTTKSKKTKTTVVNNTLKNLICDASIEALTEKTVTQHEFKLCL